jgi:hypothetical protein
MRAARLFVHPQLARQCFAPLRIVLLTLQLKRAAPTSPWMRFGLARI